MLTVTCQAVRHWGDFKIFHVLMYLTPLKNYEVGGISHALQMRKLKHYKVTQLVQESAGMKSKKLRTCHHRSYDSVLSQASACVLRESLLVWN